MDKLSEIMAAKRHALSKQIRPVRDQELERLGRMQTQGSSFLEALARKDRLSVIAEIKRKSPSAGEIAAATLDAVDQAREYVNAEVDCMSILTDTDYLAAHCKTSGILSNSSKCTSARHPVYVRTSWCTPFKWPKPPRLARAAS